ncbi:hypothetical protein MHYP_G00259720 [Metynnis hypsauchen]
MAGGNLAVTVFSTRLTPFVRSRDAVTLHAANEFSRFDMERTSVKPVKENHLCLLMHREGVTEKTRAVYRRKWSTQKTTSQLSSTRSRRRSECLSGLADE